MTTTKRFPLREFYDLLALIFFYAPAACAVSLVESVRRAMEPPLVKALRGPFNSRADFRAIEKLMAKGTRVGSDAEGALLAASRLGYSDVFEALIGAGVDINSTRLYEASKQRLEDEGKMAEAFMLHPQYYFVGRAFPTTALHMAAVSGDPGQVAMLLKHGADPAVPFGSAGLVLEQLAALVRLQGGLNWPGHKLNEWEGRAETTERHFAIGSPQSVAMCAELIRNAVEARLDAALPPATAPTSKRRF